MCLKEVSLVSTTFHRSIARRSCLQEVRCAKLTELDGWRSTA